MKKSQLTNIIREVIKEVLADNYPTFTTTKMIRVADKAITPGTWTFTGKESGGKGVYVNVINKQTYAFDMAELQAMKTSNPNDINIKTKSSGTSMNEATI